MVPSRTSYYETERSTVGNRLLSDDELNALSMSEADRVAAAFRSNVSTIHGR